MKLLLGTPLALLLVLTVAVAPVSADIDIFTWGTVGDHHLRGDTPDSGGVICTYDMAGRLVGARMRPPVVYAIDKNARRNSGQVAWRLLVDTYDPDDSNSGAHIWYRSARQLRTAWDDTPAAFKGMVVKKEFPRNGYRYRFFARMLWFGSDGSRIGESVHVVTQHKRVSPYSEDVVYGYCSGQQTPEPPDPF